MSKQAILLPTHAIRFNNAQNDWSDTSSHVTYFSRDLQIPLQPMMTNSFSVLLWLFDNWISIPLFRLLCTFIQTFSPSFYCSLWGAQWSSGQRAGRPIERFCIQIPARAETVHHSQLSCNETNDCTWSMGIRDGGECWGWENEVANTHTPTAHGRAHTLYYSNINKEDYRRQLNTPDKCQPSNDPHFPGRAASAPPLRPVPA